jgi:hypothetical protein
MNNLQLFFITPIKNKIRIAQYEALKVVYTHLINLYWTKHMSSLGRNL